MPGIEVNAYALDLQGEIEFHRLPTPEGMNRRDVERRLGLALREHDDWLWAARPTDDPSAERVYVPAGQCSAPLLAFALREAIAHRFRELGATAWIDRAGAHGLGLVAGETVSRILLEPRLTLSVVNHYDSGPLLLASARHRWSCYGTLADPELAELAPGKRALKRLGNGPETGTVERVDGHTATVTARNEPATVLAADYTVLADSSVVSRLGGATALAAVRAATGETTRTGKKNMYRVRDRFHLATQLLSEFGSTIDLPGSHGTAQIAGERLQVRMEEGP